MESNIIKFPARGKLASSPITDEEVTTNVSMVKYNHINETLATVIPILFSNIEMAGFDLSNDPDVEDNDNIRDGAMVVEAVRSILCRYYGLYHPCQDISDSVFIKTTDEDGDIYVMADHVNVTFKKTQKDSES